MTLKIKKHVSIFQLAIWVEQIFKRMIKRWKKWFAMPAFYQPQNIMSNCEPC